MIHCNSEFRADALIRQIFFMLFDRQMRQSVQSGHGGGALMATVMLVANYKLLATLKDVNLGLVQDLFDH